MEKKTKSQIIAIVKRSADPVKVVLCPSNCFPNQGHPFDLSVQVTLKAVGGEVVHVIDEGNTQPFENLLSQFAYYNCNPTMGRTIHFYVEEGRA